MSEIPCMYATLPYSELFLLQADNASSITSHCFAEKSFLSTFFTFSLIRFVAEYNARSANRELEVLMKKHIADFEKAHGKIEIE